MRKFIGVALAVIELVLIGSFLNEIVKIFDKTTSEGSLLTLGLLLAGIIVLSFLVLKTLK
jgi:hypothetical protein